MYVPFVPVISSCPRLGLESALVMQSVTQAPPANLATDNHFKTIDHLGAGWDRIHIDSVDETGKVIDAICEHNKLHG